MKQVLALTPGRLKFALIALPFLVATIYLFVFAKDRYVSESIVTVRQASTQDQGSVPGIAMLLGGVNPPSHDDTLYLRSYIYSLDLLKRLEAQLKLRDHFSTEKNDVFYRLSPKADQEQFLDYFRSRVEVVYDDNASLLTIRVQGFDPAFAQRLNQAILDDSENFVNAFSQRMARQQMAFGEQELARASAKLQAEKKKVLDFQTKNKVIDPMAQMQAAGTLTAELQAALTRQEAELRTARTYLNDNSYQIQAQRGQLEATRAQLALERQRATGDNLVGDRLNAQAAVYQDLLLQAGFAQDSYKISLAAVENARIEASRKLKSLVVIEPPSLAETAAYPTRIYNLITLLVLSVLLYGIARLVTATIREHID